MSNPLGWRVHTPGLLREVLRNRGAEALRQPINIFGDLLAQVAARAIELDDPKLNLLMLRLSLFEQGDPEKTDPATIRCAIASQEARLEKT